MSLGYPPTHRTASTDVSTWVYWYNRWVTFNVDFGGDGMVATVVGTAPTNNQPVQQVVVKTPAPARAKPRKH